MTEARQSAHDLASGMGIDRALIGELVDTFYGHIRAHDELGPIFARRVGEDWTPHLDTMKTFWGSLVFHDGQYSGRPMPAHVRLKEVRPEHFDLWLGLFEQTLVEIDASEAARTFFLERAHRIAQSFKLQMFFQP